MKLDNKTEINVKGRTFFLWRIKTSKIYLKPVLYIFRINEKYSINHPVNVFALLKGLVQGLGVGDNPQVKVFCSLKLGCRQGFYTDLLPKMND